MGGDSPFCVFLVSRNAFGRSNGWINTDMFLPISSFGFQPASFSTAGLREVIVPSFVRVYMTSEELWTIARNLSSLCLSIASTFLRAVTSLPTIWTATIFPFSFTTFGFTSI
ncbi:Uncharacterised protein [uncultured archaeon]|nr:Uncharacterised protein [uncultured archaeon]